MEAIGTESSNKRSKALVKAFILLVFIVAAIMVVRFTPVKDYLTAEALGRFLDAVGFWAPFVFMVIYAVGVCIFLPGTLLTGLGAAIFGDYMALSRIPQDVVSTVSAMELN